ncbi:MAG: outer membrane beta-barrel family protein [Phocaeicola sp.]|uniref:outer membrane beta-barrel family protein n=1 Tax=Phocaeicola TaxID=909656 RepID=UPI00234F437B|nr:outer membrane beta-barrel protein [Phocaeicola oris]MCE2616704.1 TonB-dependent receptor [Phocaeicola oris]
MKTISYLFMMFFTTFPFVAQAQQIKGKLVDKAGVGIANATLVFQQVQDSTFICATTSNQVGEFAVSQSIIPCRIIIQHLAFNTKIITGEKNELGNITLDERAELLDEVVIKASRPIMKVSDDGALAYNTKEIRRNRPVRNALDILDEVPIIQKTESNYEIIGAGKTSVILNGRKSNMSAEQLRQYLMTVPPEQVKSVEVFYNTPPQYGVKGASINVVLEKQRSDKLQIKGDIYTTLSQKFYYSQNGGFNLSMSQDCWSWNLGYSIDKSVSHYELQLNSLHTIKDETTYDIAQSTHQKYDHLSHRIYSDFSFDLKNKDSFRLLYTGKFTDNQNKALSDMSITNIKQMKSENNIDGNNGLHNISAEYAHKSWNIGLDYMHYQQESNQNLANTDAETDKDRLLSGSEQKVNKVNLYVHHGTQLNKGRLSYGIDASLSNTDNTHDVISNAEIYDDGSFRTSQKEKSFSAFIGYNQHIGKKGMFNIALKGEYFNSKIETEKQKSTLWNEFHLFPSLTFVYKVRPDRTWQISFSSQKNYPAYWKTTPSKIYMNPYCISEGNPSLKPYETYQLNANHIIKNKYIIGVFGDINPNYSTQLMYQNPQRLWAVYKYVNFDYSGKVGIMGIVPVKWNDYINTRLSMTFFAMKQKGELENISFNRDKISGRINMANNVTLNRSRTLSFQLSGWYQLPMIQGIYDVENMYNTSAALSWLSKQGNWNVTLKAEDLFNCYRMKTKVEGYSQHYSFNNQVDSQSFSLTVRYILGKYKEGKKKETDASRLGI